MLRLYQLLSKRGAKGFTMIELLVVMGILSILVGIGINTYSIAQKKARDARRKADLRQIQTALELYRQDNGKYPQVPNQASATGVITAPPHAYGTNYVYTLSTSNSNWLPALTTGGYISKMPQDPAWKSGACTGGPWYYCKGYAYGNVPTNGLSYDLVAGLEDPNDPDACRNQTPAYNQAITTTNLWCPEDPSGTPTYENSFNVYVLHP